MTVFEDKIFVAKKIKEYRKYAGFTQSELAEKIGLGEKQICKIETGISVPSLFTFLKLVDILNIDITEFGLNSPKGNPKRLELEKFLYSLNDKEVDFYINSIKDIKTNYEKYFKK